MIRAIFMNVALASESGLSIHLAPPIVGELFGIPLTSTMLTAWLTMVVLIVLAIVIRARLSLAPSKGQVATELLVGGAYDYVSDVLGDKVLARRYYPLIMTIFLFILFMNWIGLLPGVDSIGMFTSTHSGTGFVPFLHPANTDLNMTIAIAIIAFVAIEISGVICIGLFKYAGKFLNFSSPLKFLIGIIELFSELARLISFSFRLFGNIFAGKTLLLITLFFAPLILPVPILAFEMFVGFIQAFIFAVLTLFFIKLAIEEPH